MKGFRELEEEYDNPMLGQQNAQADWDAAIKAQTMSAEQEAMDAKYNAFRQKLAGYEQLENDARMQREAVQQDRGTALMAVMDSIRRNKGVMDPSLNQSVSQAFGMPITGAFLVDKGSGAGTIIFGTPQKNADGSLGNGIGMMVSPEQRYKIFDRMQAGDLTKPYMMADYAAIKQSSGLTDDQLANAGFHDPSKIYVAGATTNGKATSKLFGRTAPRNSRISVFASDGNGGMTRSYYDGFTGERSEENMGTRDPNRQGKWKLVSSGPGKDFEGGYEEDVYDENGKLLGYFNRNNNRQQAKVYENDLTGERVTVNDGESLREALAGNSKNKEPTELEKAKANALNAEADLRRAQADNSGFRSTSNSQSDSTSYGNKEFTAILATAMKDPQFQMMFNKDPEGAGKNLRKMWNAFIGTSSGDGQPQPAGAAGILRQQQLGGNKNHKDEKNSVKKDKKLEASGAKGGKDYKDPNFAKGGKDYKDPNFAKGGKDYEDPNFAKGGKDYEDPNFAKGGKDYEDPNFAKGGKDYEDPNFAKGGMDYEDPNFAKGGMDYEDPNFAKGGKDYKDPNFDMNNGNIDDLIVKYDLGDEVKYRIAEENDRHKKAILYRKEDKRLTDDEIKKQVIHAYRTSVLRKFMGRIKKNLNDMDNYDKLHPKRK